MPRRNRATPLGEVIGHPARALVYANRGCLHDEHGGIRRRYNGRRWIACRLEFRAWKRGRLLAPGRYTELFFLDEATAMAAGHRPCALCRHEDYQRFTARWGELHPGEAGPTRSTGGCIGSGSIRPPEVSFAIGCRSTTCPTARSCWITVGRGWCWARTCWPGPRRGTRSAGRALAAGR